MTVSPNADSYARTLRQLLPPGKFWKLDPSGWLWKVLQALADELARVGDRATIDLANEMQPNTAVETLPDWLRVLGIPDETIPVVPATTGGQQIAATQKYIAQGGQSEPYFIALAAACGYPATVTQYYPDVFRCGSRCGSPLYGIDWAFVWQLNVTAGSADALTHAQLEAVINKYKPAHTQVLFNYL